MIKKITIQSTRWFLLLLSFCFYSNSINGQTIYEEQFDGGIPSTWQNNPLSSGVADSLQNSLWQWSPDGTGNQGAFWGDASTIQSPSVGNGCILFNSDFLDNNGSGTGFGEGLSPSPHAGELVSPIIDCTAFPNVSIEFYQSYRNFSSETRVEVSGDGGMTWTPFILNDEISGNASTDPGDVKLVEISSIAGGSAEVQFKFVFDGDYYFWLIDDVKLIVSPDNNMNLTRAALPLLWGTPFSQRVPVTEIDAEICNAGVAPQPNTTLTCLITNDAAETVYEQSVTRDGAFPIGTPGNDSCEVAIILEPFDMVESDLIPGVYNLNYSIMSDSMNQSANTMLDETFTITDNVIRKSPFVASGGLTVNGGGAYEFGYQFFIQNNGDIATAANFMVSAQGDNTMEGETAGIKIYEVGPEGLDEQTLDDISLVGLGTIEFDAEYQNNDVASVDLFDLDSGEQGVILNGGTHYLAMISYTGTNTVFTAINSSVDYQYTLGSHDVIVDGDGTLFSGGFNGADRIPAIEVFIEQALDPLSSEEVVNTFKTQIFPNPADQQLQLALDLDEVVSNMNIKITDAFGKVIEDKNYANLQNETLIFDTAEYATGAYFIYLRSDNKVQTQNFVIVH